MEGNHEDRVHREWAGSAAQAAAGAGRMIIMRSEKRHAAVRSADSACRRRMV
jgi:hypothetical protein